MFARYLALLFFTASTLTATQVKKRDLIFIDRATQNEVLKWQAKEHRYVGLPRHAKVDKKKKIGNTVALQRSDRKRLYDHNIFLRALFAEHLYSERLGNLKPVFDRAVFIDLGSAVLYGKGAPTVRDIYEDKKIKPHLAEIIATDINAPGARYIDKYKKKKKKLPFTVKEIELALVSDQHFSRLIGRYSRSGTFIFRSANSGPDLYYSPNNAYLHLQGMGKFFQHANVLYMYSKFLLFKERGHTLFQKVGMIDASVGLNHKKPKWTKINWKRRTFKKAVKLNRAILKYSKKPIHKRPLMVMLSTDEESTLRQPKFFKVGRKSDMRGIDQHVFERIVDKIDISKRGKDLAFQLKHATRGQRAIFYCNLYALELKRGTHQDFYKNYTGGSWRHTLRGLKLVGAHHYAEVFKASMQSLEKGAAKPRYDQRFATLAENKPLSKYLTRYIGDNEDEFFVW